MIFGPLARFLLIKGTGIPVNKGWAKSFDRFSLVQTQFRMVDTPTLLFLSKSRSFLSNRLNPSFLVPCQHCAASSLCHILSKLLIAAYASLQHRCHVANGTSIIVHPCHHITGDHLRQVSPLLTQQVTHARNEGVNDRTLPSLSFPSMLNSRNYFLIRNCFGN